MLIATLTIVSILTFSIGMLAMGYNSKDYYRIESARRHSFWPGLDIEHIDKKTAKRQIKSKSKWRFTPHESRRRWDNHNED